MFNDKLTHDIEFILEGENINLPVGSYFYPAVAEEPYFIARNTSCSQSIAFPLSQVVAAASKKGFVIELKELCDE